MKTILLAASILLLSSCGRKLLAPEELGGVGDRYSWKADDSGWLQDPNGNYVDDGVEFHHIGD